MSRKMLITFKKSQLRTISMLFIGILLILFLTSAQLIPIEEAPIEKEIPTKQTIKTEYTYNSKIEEYSDNTGNAIIHSGMRYADSSGTLIEDARSLKDCEFCNNIKLNINPDPNHEVYIDEEKYGECKDKNNCTKITIIDYNSTSFTEKTNTTLLNKDIPITVYSKESVIDDKTGLPTENKITEHLSTINLKSADEKAEVTLPFGFNKEVHIGEESTIIEIKANKTFDGSHYIKCADWNTCHDATSALTFSNSGAIETAISQENGINDVIEKVYWIINTSIIPDVAQIDDARFTFEIYSTYDQDDDGNDYIALVNFTPDNLYAVDADDINNYGPVDNPPLFSDTIDISTLPSAGYPGANRTLIFTETGKTAINLSGLTAFGMREGHDIEDDPIGATLQDAVSVVLADGVPTFGSIGAFLKISYNLNYVLSITSPTTSSPASVNPSDNITIRFNLTENGVPLTTDVTQENVTIGGEICVPVDSEVTECSGTPNACSSYGTQEPCENASCTWSSISGGTTTYDDCNAPTLNASTFTFQGTAGGATGNGARYYIDHTTTAEMTIYSGGNFTNATVRGTTLKDLGDGRGWMIGIGTGALCEQDVCNTNTGYAPAYGYLWCLKGSGTSTLWRLDNCVETSLDTDAWTGDYTSYYNFTMAMDSSGVTFYVDKTLILSSADTTYQGGYLAISTGGATVNRGSWYVEHVWNESKGSGASGCSGTPTACEVVTNSSGCSGFGCDWGTTYNREYTNNDLGWELNCTVPAGCSGLSDLFVNATYNLITYNNTQVNAVNCGGADPCDCPASGNFEINNGNICNITTTCDIGNNILRVNDGGIIISTGQIRAGGCSYNYNQGFIAYDYNNGGLACGYN